MGTIREVDVAHKLSILGEDLAVLEPLESDSEGMAAQRWEDFIAAGRVVYDHLLRLLPPLPAVLPIPSAPLPAVLPTPSAPLPALVFVHYDDPPEPPTPCASPAAARANRIVDAFALEALDPASFARIIAGEFYNGGPRTTLEDQALAVLSRGYDMSNPTSWHLSLAPLAQPAPTLAAVQETLGQLAELDSSEERLKRRHAYLNQFESSDPGASWALHVLAQIEVLRFALEWNDLSKAAKRQFHIDQFRDEHGYVDEDNKVIYKWRRRNIEPVVAGRNRLLSLYHLFGAAVLVDPYWKISSLASSRTITPALIELAPLVPSLDEKTPADVLYVRHRASNLALRRALKVVAGDVVANYVFGFVNASRPNSCLRVY